MKPRVAIFARLQEFREGTDLGAKSFCQAESNGEETPEGGMHELWSQHPSVGPMYWLLETSGPELHPEHRVLLVRITAALHEVCGRAPLMVAERSG